MRKKYVIKIVSAAAFSGLIFFAVGPHRAMPSSFKPVSTGQVPVLLDSVPAVPQLIYVSADWCAQCPGFERNVLHNRRLTSTLSRFELIHLDATATPGVWPELGRYGVQSVPALIVRTNAGTKAISAHSDFPVEAILSLLEHS